MMDCPVYAVRNSTEGVAVPTTHPMEVYGNRDLDRPEHLSKNGAREHGLTLLLMTQKGTRAVLDALATHFLALIECVSA
jgi:hypothetical protein